MSKVSLREQIREAHDLDQQFQRLLEQRAEAKADALLALIADDLADAEPSTRVLAEDRAAVLRKQFIEILRK